MRDTLPDGKVLKSDMHAPAKGMEVTHARNLDAPWITEVPFAARHKSVTIAPADPAAFALSTQKPADATRVMLQVNGEVKWRLDGDDAKLAAGQGFMTGAREMLFFAGDNLEHCIFRALAGAVNFEMYFY